MQKAFHALICRWHTQIRVAVEVDHHKAPLNDLPAQQRMQERHNVVVIIHYPHMQLGGHWWR
jgi:hypothetical protein